MILKVGKIINHYNEERGEEGKREDKFHTYFWDCGDQPTGGMTPYIVL